MTTLSKRMNANIELFSDAHSIADIGCDHAYVAIALIERGKAQKVYAMDVVKGPLEKARFNINRAGLSDKIETRLSDGAKQLSAGEADAAIIAGMGGMLMERILSDSELVFKAMSQIILQPQSDLPHFRHFLYKNGYIIENENMILEDGKYYPMMRAVPASINASNHTDSTSNTLSEVEYTYGPILLAAKHPVLKDYLSYERAQKEKLLTNLSKQPETAGTQTRISEIKKELSLNEKALAYYSI